MSTKKPYDGSIQTLLKQCEDDWGNPEENRKLLVPYGLGLIDRALYGINTVDGELIWMIGQEKNRKTTLWLNIVVNYMTAKKPEVKPHTVVDSLEPGVPPTTVRDLLICNLASRYLIKDGHTHNKFCEPCDAMNCRELLLKPKYLRYESHTKTQTRVITRARDTMMTWPLTIYGISREEGDTTNLDRAKKRWKKDVNEKGVQIVIVDHVQQYDFGGGLVTDYEIQSRVIPSIASVAGGKKVAFIAVSQVSLTSVRDARQGGGRVSAAGGQKGTQAANVEFTVSYDRKAKVIIVKLCATRTSDIFAVSTPIEPVSGAMYGEVLPYTYGQ